jgi:DNA (cytosine-5)-methyltransferase 1
VSIKLLDLFAGAGGLSLGFEMVKDNKGRPVFELFRTVEVDKYACQTLRKKHGNEKVIEGDITKSIISKKIIDECKGKVDIIVGGVPCQSFSLIGPRSGFGKKIDKFKRDKRDNLYMHFRDIVKIIRPKIVVIENVKGILSKKDSKNNKIIDKIITDFESLGYNFNNAKGDKWHVLNAADFGVPQKRERIILISIKKSWKDIKVPDIEPTHFDPSADNAEESISKGLKPYVSVYEAIGDLPRVNPKITFTDIDKNYKEKIKVKNKKIISGNDKTKHNIARFRQHLKRIGSSGVEFFDFVRPNGYKYINHHTARSQQLSDIKLFRLMKQGETAKDFLKRMPKEAKKLIKYDMRSFKDKYRKQKADEPSTTVFAHLEKDGNRFIHPSQARTYTPREAARIQSFPDDFIFEGPMSKKFGQIGNAVPPLLSYKIAKTIYSELLK